LCAQRARPITAGVNANCPAKLRESILHFGARSVMNIEGMGDVTVNQLTKRGLVKTSADIYSLTEEKLLTLERMGEKSAQIFCRKIESRKSFPWSAVIYGLGIRFVGERTAEFLAEHFGSMDAIRNASLEQLQEVNRVGPRIAKSIVEFSPKPKTVELVETPQKALDAEGVRKERGTQLGGKNLRAHGEPSHATRATSQETHRRRRRQSSGSVSKKDGLCRRRREAGSKLVRHGTGRFRHAGAMKTTPST